MDSCARHKVRREAGFTILEILIVLVILSLIAAIAIPIYANALTKSRRGALVSDLRVLHGAMKRYYSDNGFFPQMAGEPAVTMNQATLAPLSTQEYFKSVESFNSKLVSGQVTAYVAYNDGGTATEFLFLMVPKSEPASQVALIYSDNPDAPNFLDGIYFNIDGVWMSADEAI
jgi:prepilin-type N-terminal cleavage/methylation domain-containing protein